MRNTELNKSKSGVILVSLFFIVSLIYIVFSNTPLTRAALEKHYLVYLDMDENGNVLISDVIVTPSEKMPSESGNCSIKIISLSGNTLFKTNFGFKNHTVITLPYYKSGSKIRVICNGHSYEENVGVYSESCGNNICESWENSLNCRPDCKSGADDGVCDKRFDFKCDPNCFKNEDLDCNKINYLIILVFILIFVYLLYRFSKGIFTKK